jgi:hypothetical protein
VTIHHIDVQHTGATAFNRPDLFSQTREVRGKDRRGDIDISLSIHNHYYWFGVGRGVGRLFTFVAAGRVLEFELRTSGRFTLPRGVALTLAPLFTFPRFMLAGRFALPLLLALPLTLSFVFLGFGRFGLFSLVLDDEFVLRF